MRASVCVIVSACVCVRVYVMYASVLYFIAHCLNIKVGLPVLFTSLSHSRHSDMRMTGS